MLIVVVTLENWTGSGPNGVVCLSVAARSPRRRAISTLFLLLLPSFLPRLVPQVTATHSLPVACRSANTQICKSFRIISRLLYFGRMGIASVVLISAKES